MSLASNNCRNAAGLYLLVELVSQGPASLHIGTPAVHAGQSRGQRKVLSGGS